MNHLYLVVSETLSEIVPILDYGQGPEEEYKIVVLVSARSRGRAKWLAWQSDKSFDGDVTDMPKLYTRKIGKTRLAEGKVIDAFDDHPLWKRTRKAEIWKGLPQ